MRSLTACLVLVGSALLLAAEEPKDKWQKVTIKGTKAEARFPGKATEKTRKGGSQFLLEAAGGKGVYLLDGAKFALKVDTSDKAGVTTILDKARDATIKGFKAKLVSEKATTLGKHPGRILICEAPGLGHVHVRAYVTPGVFYQLIVAGPKELVESDDAKKFFASFRVPD